MKKWKHKCETGGNIIWNFTDSAKEDLINKANLIGANAIFYTKYYKTTGSEAGTGRGIHHFTIHNYAGRAMNIGKKSPNGKYSAQDLTFINKQASELKDYYKNKNKKSRKYRIIFWLIIILIFIKHFILVIVIILLIETFFSMYKEGLWLEKKWNIYSKFLKTIILF